MVQNVQEIFINKQNVAKLQRNYENLITITEVEVEIGNVKHNIIISKGIKNKNIGFRKLCSLINNCIYLV